MSIINENDIARCVRKAVEDYFNDLDGEKPHAIHDMVIRSVEKPLDRTGDGSRRGQPDARS